MINTKFMDNYFKFLFLSFWPIIWYELIFVSDPFIKSITLYYRISTLTAFIFTLFSLLLFPTSLFFLTLKVIFVFIYLYLSYTKLFKYKIEEGLVGILASLLLLVIMFRY